MKKKRWIKKCTVVLSVMLLLCFGLQNEGSFSFRYASASTTVDERSIWLDADGEVQYPEMDADGISIATKSFKKRIADYQIPECVIRTLSTDTLFRAVLHYPLIISVLSYDTPEAGVYNMAAYFTALRELLERDDIYSYVYERYIQSEIPQTANADYDIIDDDNLDESLRKLLETEGQREKVQQDSDITMANLLEEVILAQDEAASEFSADEKRKIVDTAVTKVNEKKNSKLYEYNGDSTFLKTVIYDQKQNDWKGYVEDNYQVSVSDDALKVQSFIKIPQKKQGRMDLERSITRSNNLKGDSNTFCYTPKGTKVSCIIKSDNSPVSDDTLANFKASNPGLEVVSRGTVGNNCHAFAWAGRKDIWMNMPSAYVDDGSYKLLSGGRPTANHQIAVWNFPSAYAHSAVVSNYSREDPEVKGKCGAGPFAKGPASLHPFLGTIRYYKCVVN